MPIVVGEKNNNNKTKTKINCLEKKDLSSKINFWNKITAPAERT